MPSVNDPTLQAGNDRRQGPDPDTLYPLPGFPRAVFLKNVITRSNIEVGEYTYYDDPDGAERFEERNVLYHHDFLGDTLRIGKFCALATGVRFIMNGANHSMDGFSTYPFEIFGGAWGVEPDLEKYKADTRGDTVIGNDVWIGNGATILPGVQVGHGAIIGSGAVVAKDVPPYGIALGHPAEVVKRRFDEETIAALLEAAWWDWSPEHIAAHLPAIRQANRSALRDATVMVRESQAKQ